MKLDELARRSAGAARVSVAHLEAPPIGDRSPRGTWKPLVAATAVLALVVGGLAVLVRDRTGGDAPAPADSVLPTVVPVPRLGLVLDGWTVSFAQSYEELDRRDAEPTFTYYGDAAADDPFAGGDLLIAAFAGADPASGPTSPDGGEITVRGTTASVSSGSDQGLPTGATSISWYEEQVGGTVTEIVLVSRAASVDELAAIAAELTVDGDTVTPAPGLGLDRLVTSAGTPFDGVRGSGDGYLVAYESDDGSNYVTITSTAGTLAQDEVVMRWWTDEVQPVDIAGRPGFVATFGESMADLGPSLSWSPADGIVASISHFGADDTIELIELASTAFEIDDATWATYQTATAAGRAGADEFDEIFGQVDGTLDDSEYTWVLGLQGTDLCFNLQVGNDGSGSCRPRDEVVPPEGSALTIDNAFGPTLAHIVIAADPAVEQIVESQGRYTIERVDADGLSWFVALGDADVQPSFDVIVDGAVVDTLEAAVEAIAERAPSVTMVPGAAELGIDDSDLAVAGGDAEFSWWLAPVGDELCLLTGGEAPATHCVAAGDLVVFPPVVAPVAELTFVVARDLPPCVTSVRLDGMTEEIAAGGGDERHTYEVRAGIGESDGWQLVFADAGGERAVSLPTIAGAAPYPPSLCDG